MEANFLTIVGYHCKICKKKHKQGEILFAEHYEQNFPPPEIVKLSYEDCWKLVGIKEVVEWLEQNFEPTVPMSLDYEKWHAKLKEWGIE